MGGAAARDGAGARRPRPAGASPTALLCFAEYSLGHAGGRRGGPRRERRGLDALPDEQLAARLDAPYYLGFAEYFCEHYDDAIRHFRRGIAVSRATGQGQFVVPMMVGLAHALERRGRSPRRSSTADAAVEAARLAGNRQLIGFALVAEAWTAAALGDIERARAAAEEAVALLDGLDESVLTRATHAHVGVMWLEIGEPDRCLEQLRAVGLPDFPLIEPGRRGWLYAVLARAELARGDRDAAAEWVARSEATVAGPGAAARRGVGAARARALALDDGDAPGAAELALRAAERADAVERAGPRRALPDARRRRAGARRRARRGGPRCSPAPRRELAACGAAPPPRRGGARAAPARPARHRPPAPRRRARASTR